MCQATMILCFHVLCCLTKILQANHGFVQHLMDLQMFGDLSIQAVLDDSHDAEGSQWLNCSVRCFGDKGDVEDITEGLSQQ